VSKKSLFSESFHFLVAHNTDCLHNIFSMDSKPEIIIIGGGIIGLSTAVELAGGGARVTVLEKDRVGFGCSYGNAGWMTPCFALPLPMPGLFFKSIKWLLDPEGPLYIKPSVDPLLFRWLTRFMLSMNEKQTQGAIEALVLLSQVSLQKYAKLAMEFPQIDFKKNGLLMVAQTKSGVAAAVEEMERVRPHGVPGRFLEPNEVAAMEPALTGFIEGAVYFPEEGQAEPLRVVQALAQKALALGVQIREGVEVQDLEINNRAVQGLITSQGNLKADTYVLATGSWSQEIGKKIGLRVPILGGKGYAMIVPPLEKQPRYPMMLIEKKIAITPRENSLRISGTLELVNQDFSITEKRVKAIFRGTREFLTLPETLDVKEVWRGLRPCTPDGVPMLGFTKKAGNLMLACGHQMLGLQAGYGTGQLVAELILHGKSELYRTVYDPDRF
jgi:D-amino-acid dehydrogenase